MAPSVQKYFDAGLAQSTHKSYSSALKRFHALYGFIYPFPVTEHILCYYASYLADNNLAPQTIKLYLAAVRNLQISLGLPDPREQSSLPLLKRVQAGISRLRTLKGVKGRIRLPITAAILRQIKSALEESDLGNKLVWWAICCTAFFGFFRRGELLVDTPATFCQATDLAWGDIAVDDLTNPRMLCVHLKKSKIDQFGTGADIILGRTDKDLCPVAALLNYIVVRGTQLGPFFVDTKSHPCQSPASLQNSGRSSKAWGFPMRNMQATVLAATSASLMGMEDSMIQTLGRWRSDAFLRYIRTPREQLAAATVKLAT